MNASFGTSAARESWASGSGGRTLAGIGFEVTLRHGEAHAMTRIAESEDTH